MSSHQPPEYFNPQPNIESQPQEQQQSWMAPPQLASASVTSTGSMVSQPPMSQPNTTQTSIPPMSQSMMPQSQPPISSAPPSMPAAPLMPTMNPSSLPNMAPPSMSTMAPPSMPTMASPNSQVALSAPSLSSMSHQAPMMHQPISQPSQMSQPPAMIQPDFKKEILPNKPEVLQPNTSQNSSKQETKNDKPVQVCLGTHELH